MSEPLLRAEGISKRFITGEGATIEVLRDLSLEVARGEKLAILGQSGIGKSTLLYVLGTLDHPSEGRVWFEGEDIFTRDGESLARFRNASLGFVFQFHHLLPEFTALENVMMPGLLRGLGFGAMRERAAAILAEVELSHRLEHPVGKLSGGERQRVAVARALVLDPPLVLADEPTGNLDETAAASILALLSALHERFGQTFLMVTHDPRAAATARRVIRLDKGRVLADTEAPSPAGAAP
jgi:lipoprotein-releasing system ATP-binding protein